MLSCARYGDFLVCQSSCQWSDRASLWSEQVLILQHPKEAKKKVVKTADLIALCLSHHCCEVLTGKDFSSVLATFAQGRQSHDRWLLLWPGAEATPIDALALTVHRERGGDSTARETAQPALRTTLVVLDGTWQQAKQIHALNKAALDALCIHVSFAVSDREDAEDAEGGTHVSSLGWIRLQPRDHFLSTLESVGLALQTLEGQRGPSIRAALLRVFDRMNERQRVFYTAEKAHAPAQKQKKKAIDAMEATLVEPSTRSAEGKPKYFVLCREERTAEDRRMMRQVGNAVLCTFDGTIDAPTAQPGFLRVVVRYVLCSAHTHTHTHTH